MQVEEEGLDEAERIHILAETHLRFRGECQSHDSQDKTTRRQSK